MDKKQKVAWNKKTYEEFEIEFARCQESDFIKVDKTTFDCYSKKVLAFCEKHNCEFTVKPYLLLKGNGCKYCRNEKISNSLKRSKEQYEKVLLVQKLNFKCIGDYLGANSLTLHECGTCGYEWNVTPQHLLNYDKQGCPCCNKSKLVEGKNDLWTTHPDIASQLKYVNFGYEITSKCDNYHVFICPVCKSETLSRVNRWVNGITRCKYCNDKISYPEKFMLCLLRQTLGDDFKFQKTFDWSNNKRYDFVLFDDNIIIETHGRQHYEEVDFCGNKARTLVEEQINDTYKKRLAHANNINKYIIINCRISNVDWIKNSILDGELAKILDLSNVDWSECDNFAKSSFIDKVAQLWEGGTNNVSLLARETGLSKTTIRNYLKIATKMNLCEYIPALNNKKKVICNTTGMIFNSIREGAMYYKINASNLSSHLNNNRFSAGIMPNGDKMLWAFID